MIDSSPMYGRAEGVTGDLVAELGLRPRVFLATKVWTSGRDQGIAQMRRSAELLKSPVLDLIQIHNLLDWRTHLATLRQMKEQGQVRYIGITHYTTGSLVELARILDSEPGIDFVQFGYSLATRDAEDRLFPTAAARAGRGHRQPAVRDRRHVPPGARPRPAGMGRRVRLRQLGPAVPEIHRRRAGGDLRDPGDRQPEHMQDNLQAGFGRLPDAGQRRRIREFWDAL